MGEFPAGMSYADIERVLRQAYPAPTDKQSTDINAGGSKRYRITSPDGRTFEVTAPEGATQDEVLAYAQANHQSASAEGPWSKYQQSADGPWTKYQSSGGQGSADPREELNALRRLKALEDKAAGNTGNTRLQSIEQALRAADAAGNTDDARQLAQAYAQERDAQPQQSNRHKAWSAVAASPQYQALPPQQQEAARQQYFAEVVAPQIGDPSQVQQAKAQFDAETGPRRMKLSQVLAAEQPAWRSKFGGIPVEGGSRFGGIPVDNTGPDFSNVTGGVQTMQRQRAPVPYNGPMLAPSRTADRAPAPPTLDQINAANRAERQQPGYAADQQRIAMENRRAEFKQLPAAMRFAVGAGQRVAQAGRGLGQAYAWGADQISPNEGASRYQQALADQAQARQRDAYMQGDTAAAVGGFAGDVGLTLAPGGAVGRLGGLRAIGGSAALGGGYAALQPVIAGESRADNAKMGAAFGAGGQALGAGISAVGRNAVRAVPSDIRQMVTRARELGIPVHASQVSQSLPVKVAASAGKYLPFSGYGKAASAQQVGANRAVARTFGANADKLTDDVMQAARRKLNAGFEAVYNRNNVPITPNGARKLAQVESQAMRRLTSDQGQVLRNQVDDILSNADNGILTGQKYQAVRSSLKKSEGNDKLGMAVREVRQALDDMAAEAVGPQDAAKLKELRSQWANFRTTETVLKQNAGAGGDIRLGALWPAIRKGSTKEMRELARMGQTLLKDPISDSGTAQRSFAYNMLMGGGSIANPALIPVFAKAALGGATVGRAANSPTLARLLARESRGVPTSRLGALLEETSPVLAPALARQYGGGGR